MHNENPAPTGAQATMVYTADEAAPARTRRLWAIGVAIALCALYGLLYTPHWVRAGDGEVYLGIARNLLQGEGYRFNGQPVGIIPPLWSLVIAGAMAVSSSLTLLNLLPMGSMIGFGLISYFVLRRFASPQLSAASVLLTALLSSLFRQSIWFHSDAFFALLAAVSLLLALQINEGRASTGRIALLALLCIASMGVRWNALLFWPLIAAALLRGRRVWPQLDRRWFAMVLTAGVTAGSFILLRWALRVDPSSLDPRYDAFLSGAYSLVNRPDSLYGWLDRVLLSGGWLGGLFWQFAYNTRAIRLFVGMLGWVVIAALLVLLVSDARRREWIWIALVAHTAPLVFNWPHPLPRYLLPIAPLLMLGVLLGAQRIRQLAPVAMRPMITAGQVGFIASVLLLNLPLYAIDVWVARSSDFYGRYQAGVHRELQSAAKWLIEQPHGAGEIAISQVLVNHNRPYTTDGFMRAMAFLTDRAIMKVPVELCREPDAELIEWANRHGVRYYLYQPPIALTLHFRGVPWPLRGHDDPPLDTQWRLYEIDAAQARRVGLPAAEDWPTHVPGLKED